MSASLIPITPRGGNKSERSADRTIVRAMNRAAKDMAHAEAQAAFAAYNAALAERIANFGKMLELHIAALEALNAKTDAHHARLKAEGSWFG